MYYLKNIEKLRWLSQNKTIEITRFLLKLISQT